MKHSCRNCHFLAKLRHDEAGKFVYSWSKAEREKGQVDIEGIYSPFCRRGIWDTGISPELKSNLEEIINENRRDDCFFVECREGMSFPGAIELHKIRYETRHLKRSFFIAATGLYLSAFAALLNFIGFDNFKKLVKTIFEWLGM